VRKSKADAAESRRRIVAAAANAFKQNGIRGTGLADVMADAGMTQGGFYRHFESKDDLVAEACAAGLKDALDAIGGSGAERPAMSALIDAFLSTDSAKNPLQDCPFVALGSELARADDRTRELATIGLLDFVASIANRFDRSEQQQANATALFLISSIVGTLTLSRFVTDPALAKAILGNSRERLADVVSQPGGDKSASVDRCFQPDGSLRKSADVRDRLKDA
jgi:TetR/AcrR family transcriptional repressor of nem operon